MDLETAKTVMLRTHASAVRHNERANCLFLQSPPGIGKSDSNDQYVQKLAETINEPVAVVVEMMATYTSPDVRGFMIPIKTQTMPGVPDTAFSLPPWYPTRNNIRVCEPDGTWHERGQWSGDVPRVGVLLLDEFSQAEDEVKKPAAELLYRGGVGNVSLPKLWRVIGCGNRLSDRSGVMREMMFLVNRRCLLNIDPSLPTWINWASRQPDRNRPHYLTISFAQKNPDIVFRDSVPDGTDPFCTPRTLCLLDKDLMALRTAEDEAKDRLPTDQAAREVAAGWIGGASAAQYFTHLKYADELPDMADIEKDPAKAKLPPNRDAQMVAAYMLAHSVTEKNAQPVMAYIARMNIEMQVLAVRAVGASPSGQAKHMLNTKEFSSWLAKHKDLLVASRS